MQPDYLTKYVCPVYRNRGIIYQHNFLSLYYRWGREITIKGGHMLKKEKGFGKDNESEASKLTEKKRFSMSTSSDTTDKKTVIGEHIFIEGNIRGEEHLVVEGSMKGNIEMKEHNFIVGSKGRFEGEILAQNVGVNGQIIGSVNAKGKVEIKNEADMIGDIKANSISVEEGAYFKGSIEMNREPHRKAALTKKPIEMPTPQKDKTTVSPLDDAGKKS
jgi:cytoskeletal protein CcmA (bactofilin family)